MGKVYDALRRAEERRSQSAGGSAAPPVPAGARFAERRTRGRLAFWKRWLGVGRVRAIAEDAGSVNKRRIAMLRPESFVAEQFRSLRARLDSLAAQHPLRTIAVTSALPGEGKTMAAVNLALVSAMSVGRRVLLIDCDLRKPRVHTTLGLQPEAGLAEVLTDRASPGEAIVKVEGVNLEVLPVRAQPPNPSELLASARMRSLMEELARAYDRVILDVPPALALPDAKSVSEITDGVVLVVRADSTPAAEVEATLDILDRRRVLGLVLNGIADASGHYGYPGGG